MEVGNEVSPPNPKIEYQVSPPKMEVNNEVSSPKMEHEVSFFELLAAAAPNSSPSLVMKCDCAAPGGPGEPVHRAGTGVE